MKSSVGQREKRYYPQINQGKTIMKPEVKKKFRHSIELLIHRSSYTTLKVFFLTAKVIFLLKLALLSQNVFFPPTRDYLTIIPQARMGSESIAHDVEGSRANFFFIAARYPFLVKSN